MAQTALRQGGNKHAAGGAAAFRAQESRAGTHYITDSRNAHRGLTAAEVSASRDRYGANLLPRAKKHTFARKFLSNLGDPVIKILLFALGVNIIFLFRDADWFETAGIALSVFAATLISTVSEYGSEAAYARLCEGEARGTCRVRRDGNIIEIPVGDVVVGDIVLLGTGEQVPADGVAVSGEIGLDMAAMTGEGNEVRKRPSSDKSLSPGSPSAVLRGCFVTSGSAEVLVGAVGEKTFLGGISREVQSEVRDSPLKVRLTRLARQISRLGYIAAVAVALAFLFNVFVLDSGMSREVILYKLADTRFVLSRLLDAFTLGLTVIVVAVPEGLPMMIAVVLSSNVRRMIRAGVLVKKPVGIEAAGSMNILFTDKTGTLTGGAMAVSEVICGGGERRTLSGLAAREPVTARLYRLSAIYNTSSVASGGKYSAACGGNATDRAILSSLSRLPHGGDSRSGDVTVLKYLPFTSERKYSAVSLRIGRERITVYKGAPELLLPRTDRRIAGGSELSFDRSAFTRLVADACRSGARRALVIAYVPGTMPDFNTCAYRDGSGASGALPSSGTSDAADSSLAFEIPQGLTLVCAILLRDPLRPEALHSVAALRGAGVHVVMVTGDSEETATAIGRECGIIGTAAGAGDGADVDTVLSSSALARLDDAGLGRLLPRLGVVCRALPEDKSRLIRVAQSCGMVCGMTGDGINDAPALRAADVGFAMGSGTALAKDAGDIVILDDNMKSIANAVLYGRNIFKSIRKFISLQLTMNLCAVAVSMAGPFIGVDAPVTVVQMLWINIIMDTLGGLAFAGEAALPSLMREKPKRRDEPILNRYMVNQILTLGLFTVCMSIAFLKWSRLTTLFRPSPGDVVHLTAFFAFFIFAGVFNCFNCRSDRLLMLAGIGKNPAFVFIMTAVLIIQIVFVYIGGPVLRTLPLTARELTAAMLMSLTVFPAEFLRRLVRKLCGYRDGI